METPVNLKTHKNEEVTQLLKRGNRRGSIPFDKIKDRYSIVEKPDVKEVLENHIKNTYNYKNLTPEKLLDQLERGIITLSDIEEERKNTIAKLYQFLFIQQGQANTPELGYTYSSLLEELEVGKKTTKDISIQERDTITRIYNILSKPLETYTPPKLEDIKEFWKKDRKDNDTVISFIQRVYAPWLGKGLIQADIRPIDRPLYNAFQQWKFREKPIPENFILPKKSDEEVSLPSQNVLDAEKQAKAIKARLAYRKKKKTTS